MKNRSLKLLIFSIACFTSFLFYRGEEVMAASSPYDVETSVKNNWDNTYGTKTYSQRSGQKLVYDVYSSKYISGGYQIVNKNFGNGNQPYINFRGWAVLMGYKRHTSSNHETYIVARKTAGDSGVGTTYVYGTLPVNISATEDLEYNNKGSGVWNECSSSSTKKDNQLDCNMRYDNVGFNAFLPLNQLFPSKSDKATWKLYIVKRVDNHIVWDILILPFTFDNRSYNGGEISLTSGVNANTLKMIGTDVLRRSYPRETASSVINKLGSNRYFTTSNNYTRVSADETETAVWYGVRSPHDNNATKWANTAYWQFSGEQAQLTYIPNEPPKHIEHSISYNEYTNGNDYWVQPGNNFQINLRQYDAEGENKYQYLRLDGSGVDARVQHDFSLASTFKNYFRTSSHISMNSATRIENNKYGQVKWNVTAHTHGHSYNVLYYYTDKFGNEVGYGDTGMNVRVDGKVPTHQSDSITGYRYQNGNDYWVRPNDSVEVRVRQRDPDSGNRKQYIRFIGEGLDVRSEHRFYEGSTYNNHFWTSSHISIDSAYREENTSYGKVKWTVTPKTHGHSYDIHYYFQDNVYNSFADYVDTGKNLRVDGVGPDHLNEEITDYRYKDGNTYWVRPYDVVNVVLRSSDPHSGLKESTLSTGGGNNRVVAKHFWNDGNSTNLTLYDTSPEFDVLSVARTYQSGSTKEVTFSVQGYTHGASHIIRHRYIDNVDNLSDGDAYGFSSYVKRISIDGEGPTVLYRDEQDKTKFESRDWDDSPIQVRLKFSDEHSGYKRSRYAWTQSTSTPSNWSNWTSNSNYVVSKDTFGEWYLHVQTEDNVGNVSTVVKGPYKFNTVPDISLTYNPSEVWEGDDVQACIYVTDADNNKMSIQLNLKVDNGPTNTVYSKGNISSGSTNCTTINDVEPSKEHVLTAIVDDGVDSNTVTISFTPKPLGITGKVLHTDEWLQKHKRLGTNWEEEFFSGEKFILEADVSPYPTNYVRVTFKGNQVNGSTYNRTITFLNNPNTATLRKSELFEEAFMKKGTQLREGPQQFEFEVQYSNGVIKKDNVQIRIIGSVLEAMNFHKKH